jgi:hypothetical protein
MTAADKEALRQQMLLRALLGDARPGVVGGWMREGARFSRGLAAYRANAGALAERALAAAYPTLQQLIGDESFAALARALWQRHPPLAGDIALWGADLPAFVADAESLADEPYLADVARLEWLVHGAESAADAEPVQGLERLASHDPGQLWLHLVPGTALLVSAHPVVSIWQAHRAEPGDDPDRFAAVRLAFAAGTGENAVVTRQGWQPRVRAVTAPEARFMAAVLAGRSVGQALQESGAGFDFEAWLITTLQQQGLAAVATAPKEEPR